jgi:hypothetical protein
MNAFLALADRQIAAPIKARRRAVEKRVRKAAAERELLSAAWRQRQGQRRDALLTGPYGDDARHLIGVLKGMAFDQGAALIRLIDAGPWRDANVEVRFEILALIDEHIVDLRARHGLPPFDDNLPDEQLTVFQIVREALQ